MLLLMHASWDTKISCWASLAMVTREFCSLTRAFSCQKVRLPPPPPITQCWVDSMHRPWSTMKRRLTERVLNHCRQPQLLTISSRIIAFPWNSPCCSFRHRLWTLCVRLPLIPHPQSWPTLLCRGSTQKKDTSSYRSSLSHCTGPC